MASLPTPGQNNADWGSLLSTFLKVAHEYYGGLKADPTIAGLYVLPSGGVDRAHFDSTVSRLLNKADTAVQPGSLTVEDLKVTVSTTLSGGGGASYGPRKRLNFIPGANLDVIATDNPNAGQVSLAMKRTDTGALPKALQKDGGTLSQRAVLDFEAGPYVTDDAGNDVVHIEIKREYLNITDPRIGVTMASQFTTLDQGAKLQAAFDLAGTSPFDACVYFPGGDVSASQQLTMPVSRPIRILGSGSTRVHWMGAQASGSYGIKCSGQPYMIEHIGFYGPGYFNQLSAGDIVSNMAGVLCDGPGLMKDVIVAGFGSGIAVRGGGQEWRSCNFAGNGYGMNWIDNPTGQIDGGHLVYRCFLTDQTRASIAVSSTSTIRNARFKGNGHCGMSPFGIYRYAGTGNARTVAIDGLMFENWSFENCGNGFMYDEPGDGIWKDIVMDNASEANTYGHRKWPGKPIFASIDIGHANNIHWREAPIVMYYPHPQISARSIKNLRIDGSSAVGISSDGLSRPFHIKPEGLGGDEISGVQIGQVGRSVGLQGSVRVAEEAIARYDLVEMSGYNRVRVSRNNSGSMIVGVATNDYAAGEACTYVVQGDFRFRNKSGASIPKNRLVKPDPSSPGCVMPAGSQSDGPILGRVVESPILNNSDGRCFIMLA